MKKIDQKETFLKTVPVMFGYLFLGFAFGILMEQAGFHVDALDLIVRNIGIRAFLHRAGLHEAELIAEDLCRPVTCLFPLHGDDRDKQSKDKGA